MAEEILEELESTDNKSLFVVIGIILVAILLIGGYLLFSSQGIDSTGDREQQEGFGQPTGSETSAGMVIGNNAIYATASADDDTVRAIQVILENNGYVVVHADDNGQPGEVIGHSEIITSGQITNLEIELDEDIQAGDTVYAMLHGDDGDGVYEFPDADDPVIHEDGTPVMMRVNVEETSTDEEIIL